MEQAKEKILFESLKLFSQNGYDGVSMRDIAHNLNITAGAIYRHYSGKQDIFDTIIQKMKQFDNQFAKNCNLPIGSYANDPQSYRNISKKEIINFTLEMFQFWTENEFASAFRKMLTLEQYRSIEMNKLYQQYFGSGVLTYLSDLFRENGYDNPEIEATKFYGPFYLLLNQYDTSDDKSILKKILERCYCELPQK